MNYLQNLQSVIIYGDNLYISSNRPLSIIERFSSFPMSRESHPFEFMPSFTRYIPCSRALPWICQELGIDFITRQEMFSKLADYYGIPFPESVDDEYFVRLYLCDFDCYTASVFTPVVPGVKLKTFYRYDLLSD